MTTITSDTGTEIDAEPRGVAMRDVGWDGYRTLLKVRGERSFPRMIYLDGTVWLMSPGDSHERIKKLLGLFVSVVVMERDIPCQHAGSTTFRRKKKDGGIEPDECFYFANTPRVRGKRDLHLSEDTPPDLAVEAVSTHAATAAVEIYRRFGVPEVWVCDGMELTILILQRDGQYAESKTSAAFPFLNDAEILGWVTKSDEGSDTRWLKDLQNWVRHTLLPRVRDAAGGA